MTDARLRELAEAFDRLQPSFGPPPDAYLPVVAQALVRAAHGRGRRACVLDLGCGTGAALRALGTRAPGRGASTSPGGEGIPRRIGVESDPVLLQLAAVGADGDPADGVEVVDADFRGSGWSRGVLGPGEADVVLAARALHYPSAHEVAEVYRHAHRLLRPGGLLVEADRFPGSTGAAGQGAVGQGAVGPEPCGAAAAPAAWRDWWRAAEALPEMADAVRRRAERPLAAEGNTLTAAAHARLLRRAGFRGVRVRSTGGGDAVVLATA